MQKPIDRKKLLLEAGIKQPPSPAGFAAKAAIALDEAELDFWDFGGRLNRLRATAEKITGGRYALTPNWRADGTRAGYTIHCDTDALCVHVALAM
jgi:hypothetical protein